MEKVYLTIQEAKDLGLDIENINNEVNLEDIVDEHDEEVLPEESING